MGRRRQCAARDQSRLRLVDDGDHEDRSRRAKVARTRGRPQRVRRLSGSRHYGVSYRLHCRTVRSAAGADLFGRCLAILGTALSILLVRDTRGHVHLEIKSSQQGTSSRGFWDIFTLTSTIVEIVDETGLRCGKEIAIAKTIRSTPRPN